MNRTDRQWLHTVIVDAKRAGWCTKPFCTTCGSFDFRRAYWMGAATQAGLVVDVERARTLRALLEEFSPAERNLVVRTIVSGLRELPPMHECSDALRTIIIDLDPPLLRHRVPLVLDEMLANTPAGDELRRMREHAAQSEARRQRMRDYENAKAVEERKLFRQAEKAAVHFRRLQEKRQKDVERLATVTHLASMSPTDRLLRFATDSELNLDSVPAELIPISDVDPAMSLEASLVDKLVARIGGRRGAWGQLRRMLRNRSK